jgi:Cupin domain
VKGGTSPDMLAMAGAGEITFKIGEEVTVGGPGTCAFMPRGLAHAWKNSGAETARVLFLYTPAGAGGFFEESQRLRLRIRACSLCPDSKFPRKHTAAISMETPAPSGGRSPTSSSPPGGTIWSRWSRPRSREIPEPM